MKRAALILSIFCLVTALPLHAEDTTFKVYPVLTSDAEVLVEAARVIIGEQGKVVRDRAGGRLMIMATLGQHAQIAELFSAVNVPSPNVSIDIDIDRTDVRKNSGAGVSVSGDVVVTPNDTRYRIGARPHIENRTTRTEGTMRQSLMVQSGREASLQIGIEIPYLEWIVSHGRHRGWIEANVVFDRAGAFLRFKPTVLGDGKQIKVEVIPEIRGVQKGRQMSVPFVELATSFTVQSGQTISLGGLAEQSEFYERFLIGVDRGGVSNSLNIRATPRIVDLK